MNKKRGADKVKLELILYVLRTNPHGSWVRDIAKKSGLKKSTVANYLNTHLKDKVEVVHDSEHIKLVKLKEAMKEFSEEMEEISKESPNYIQ
ncbi:TPA: hypothetical protein H1005_03615 [archaeon]|nr:hypothetical protein [Candidatus Naiadarchaeales archaeon SRR2090153.bin1042]